MVVLDVAFVFAVFDFVQRRLGDVDVAAFDQLSHLAVEEGEQQGADVGAVDVGISHDDDAVIAQLFRFEVFRANARAQRGNEDGNGFRTDDFVGAGTFDVQNLAAQRQNRLEFAVAALLGGAAGRVALDDVDFALRRVFFLTVCQFAGQANAVKRAFAAGEVARFAGGFAGTRGFDNLAADGFGFNGVFQQEVGQAGGDDFFHRRAGFGRDQLHFGLTGEFGVGHLDREHTGQPFAHVVTGDGDFGLFGDFVFFNVFVDDAGHRGAQPGEVGAAVGLGNVVGETLHLFVVGVVPLHGDFDGQFGADAAGIDAAGAGGVKDAGVQAGFGAVDVFDEAFHAAGEGEVFFLAGALVEQADFDAVVEEG